MPINRYFRIIQLRVQRLYYIIRDICMIRCEQFRPIHSDIVCDEWHFKPSWLSSVSTVTGLRAGQPKNHVSICGKAEGFKNWWPFKVYFWAIVWLQMTLSGGVWDSILFRNFLNCLLCHSFPQMLQPVTWYPALLSAWSVSLARVSWQKESFLTLNM